MNGLVITRAVEYSDLNPNNYALKNTYVSNLLTTAIATLPIIEKISEGVVSIVRGFESKKCIATESTRPSSLDYKFGEGLALEIQIDPYNHHLVVVALKKIIDETNACFQFHVDRHKRRVVIYRAKKTSKISEELPDEKRILFVEE